jgi:hypothetical protein
LKIERRKTTNDDWCRRSLFGCHVTMSDVAPTLYIQNEKNEDDERHHLSFIVWLPRRRGQRSTLYWGLKERKRRTMTDVIVRRLVATSLLATWHLQLVLEKKKGEGSVLRIKRTK